MNHAQLWLTARALRQAYFTMPADARRLIEGVFGADARSPPGLEASALAADGQGFAAQAQAQMNALKLATGYQRDGIDWWSEAKTPSRLGDASSNVTLARWVNGRLQPWVDRPHGWAYSSLRVAERLAAATAEPADPALRAAVRDTLAQLPAGGRWTVLLPLTPTPQGWVGETMAAARKDQAPRRLGWVYSSDQGLRLLEATAPIETREDPEA